MATRGKDPARTLTVDKTCRSAILSGMAKRKAATLSERLSEMGLSQHDLSVRLGVSAGAVSRWVSGERQPSLEMALLLQRELGIPAESWVVQRRTGTDG